MAAERKITQKQAWQGPVKELGLSIPWQKVRELHYSIKRLNKKIIPLMKKLRKYTKIVLLSKSTRSQFTDDENNLHFKQYFDDTINTWELGIPKASKKTFLYIMKKYNVKPKEIIQIDDQEQNLIESAKLGIYTILFKNEKDLEKKISSIIDIS